ncbi:MAG: nucleoside/nucleotide kinase family protein [Microbacteriaceae bacterium]
MSAVAAVGAGANNAEVTAVSASTQELVARARLMIVPGQRRILGITGAPGSGKSTLAAALVTALDPHAALVGMDGFHLSNDVLTALGRRDRKGAPDTFDPAGYRALLCRLRSKVPGIVYAPVFDREIEESIANAVAVPATTPLVVTEGNYLLLEAGGWPGVRDQLDEVWYLDAPDQLRLDRLVRRHEAFGKSHADAVRWAGGSDQDNANVTFASRYRADLIVSLVDDGPRAGTRTDCPVTAMTPGDSNDTQGQQGQPVTGMTEGSDVR